MIEVDQETTPGKNNDSKNHALHGSICYIFTDCSSGQGMSWALRIQQETKPSSCLQGAHAHVRHMRCGTSVAAAFTNHRRWFLFSQATNAETEAQRSFKNLAASHTRANI